LGLYKNAWWLFIFIPVEQMDKTTIAFLSLLAVLFIGQVIMTENFYAATDSSGNVSLSISDLLALLGSGSSTTDLSSTYDDIREYNSLRSEIMSDVRREVKQQLVRGKFSGLYDSHDNVIDDSCIDSFSAQQGADFMKYIPGKNPDDYIRKDSVPCYGCSIPSP